MSLCVSFAFVCQQLSSTVGKAALQQETQHCIQQYCTFTYHCLLRQPRLAPTLDPRSCPGSPCLTSSSSTCTARAMASSPTWT